MAAPSAILSGKTPCLSAASALLQVFRFLLLLLLTLPASAQLVVDVHDGDTLRLQSGQRVRLWGIDAPELKQAYGVASRDHLARLVSGKVVRLEPHGEDRYGRLLAVVWVGQTCCNESLLKAGLAWWYRKYTPGERLYEGLERVARAGRVGLWAGQPVAPWEFRHPGRG